MKSILQVKKLLRLVEMMSGLVNAFLCTLLQFPLGQKKLEAMYLQNLAGGGVNKVYMDNETEWWI